MYSETNRSTPLPSRLSSASERLHSALARISALSAAIPGTANDNSESANSREALLLNLERASWSALELASIWVFELRLGMPRKPTDAFDLLQTDGRLDLDEARRLRHLAEYRNLSSRDPAAIDWDYLSHELGDDLALFAAWNAKAVTWLNPDGR